MTQKLSSISREVVKQALPQDDDFLRPLIRRVIQEILKAEMSSACWPAKASARPLGLATAAATTAAA